MAVKVQHPAILAMKSGSSGTSQILVACQLTPPARRICRTLSRLTDAITPESARYDASPADPLQTSAFGHRDRLDKYLRETSYHRLRDSARKQPVPSQSKINYTNNDLGRSGSRCCVIAEQPCVR